MSLPTGAHLNLMRQHRPWQPPAPARQPSAPFASKGGLEPLVATPVSEQDMGGDPHEDEEEDPLAPTLTLSRLSLREDSPQATAVPVASVSSSLEPVVSGSLTALSILSTTQPGSLSCGQSLKDGPALATFGVPEAAVRLRSTSNESEIERSSSPDEQVEQFEME